jgi:ATP-dependent Lon protease
MTTMLPCGNCALKDAENTNLKNALFINTLIHNYSLTDVIKNVIEEEVSKEIKKVVDTTTEEHLCKLKTCIALKDARIEHLVQTDTEKDLERAKKDLEREVRDGKLDKYIEILIQSNKEKDCSNSQLNEKIDEISRRFEEELTEVKKELNNIVNTLSAREIGASADRFALNQIFPNCRGKKFSIQTLAELNVFLNNINLNNKLVSKEAKTSWVQLSHQERDRIKDDFDKMLNAHPGLLDHIKYLKSHNHYAHRISGNGKIERTYFYLKNNIRMTEGIDCCFPLVPKAEFNNK